MHPRARALIRALDLRPHPEGGYFREVFRSSLHVGRATDGERRSALTTIFFLLTEGEHSAWHRVAGADEAWHFYEGDPLELLCLDRGMEAPLRWTLGPVDGDASPVHVVPADAWQAARTGGAYTLAGCSVGPGFEFADFAMLRDLPDEAARLRALHPALAELL